MPLGYFNSVLSNQGNPIQATITVYLAGTGTKATIYSDPEGLIEKDNPFSTDALGRFQFFAITGQYDIEISGAGITTYKIEYIDISTITKSTHLLDMPQTLVGQAKRLLKVKNTEDKYEHFEQGWEDVRNYDSFSAAIDAIGANEKTLLIPNEQAVSADKNVPANIKVKVEKGGYLNIATGKNLILNNFEAGLYQVFKGDGTVSFGVGAVREVYPQWWGAVSGAECGAAILSANEACPTGGKVKITDGKWIIGIDTLTLINPKNFDGNGIGSVLWLAVGDGKDGVVFGDGLNWKTGINWKNFAILGGASGCKNGLILKKIGNCDFDGIHVLTGTAADGRAVWIQTAISCNFKFHTTVNTTYPYSPGTPFHGIIATDSNGNAASCNACLFDSIVEGVGGKGLYILCSGDDGCNEIRGTYEGNTDYGIHLKGCQKPQLHNIYLELVSGHTAENELVLENCNYPIIGPAVSSMTGSGGGNPMGYFDVQLINCLEPTILGLRCTRLSIDSNCVRPKIIEINYDTTWSDAGLSDGSGQAILYNKLFSARAYRNENQTIPNSTFTRVQFNAESYDIYGNFDVVNNRWVAPVSGVYQIDAFILYSSALVADKYYAIFLYKNGDTYCSAAYFHASHQQCLSCILSDKLKLNGGDYIQLYTQHNAGGDLDIIGNSFSSYMSIHLLSLI